MYRRPLVKKTCTTLVCCLYTGPNFMHIYSLVLIAHNGFGFHYLFLMAEIKRHNSEPIFSTSDVWFADTLHDTRRVSN